jgi:hypothetical protein
MVNNQSRTAEKGLPPFPFFVRCLKSLFVIQTSVLPLPTNLLHRLHTNKQHEPYQHDRADKVHVVYWCGDDEVNLCLIPPKDAQIQILPLPSSITFKYAVTYQ